MAKKQIWNPAASIGADHDGIVWLGCKGEFLTEENVAEFRAKYDPEWKAEVREYAYPKGSKGITDIRWYPPTCRRGAQNCIVVYRSDQVPTYYKG
jgi:hypothetical protein